jgi:transaldolase
MPPQTMDAFRDHGVVADALSGAGAVAEAKVALDDYALMETGIEEVCARLEEDGVKSFLDSYRKLLAAIDGRLKTASAG